MTFKLFTPAGVDTGATIDIDDLSGRGCNYKATVIRLGSSAAEFPLVPQGYTSDEKIVNALLEASGEK